MGASGELCDEELASIAEIATLLLRPNTRSTYSGHLNKWQVIAAGLKLMGCLAGMPSRACMHAGMADMGPTP